MRVRISKQNDNLKKVWQPAEGKSFRQVFSTDQTSLYEKLTTPAKIQDFLDTLEINFQDNYWSPKKVLEIGKAQCLEGAMFAASALRFHGYKPLLMDLRAKHPDTDHVVALFKVGSPQAGRWGAISKTNHAVLRYREPVYRNLRELAMSYFHEYFDNKTRAKNLREYSVPVDLSRFDHLDWETTNKPLPQIAQAVDDAKHFWLINKAQEKLLRRADTLEIEAGKLVEWKNRN